MWLRNTESLRKRLRVHGLLRLPNRPAFRRGMIHSAFLVLRVIVPMVILTELRLMHRGEGRRIAVRAETGRGLVERLRAKPALLRIELIQICMLGIVIGNWVVETSIERVLGKLRLHIFVCPPSQGIVNFGGFACRLVCLTCYDVADRLIRSHMHAHVGQLAECSVGEVEVRTGLHRHCWRLHWTLGAVILPIIMRRVLLAEGGFFPLSSESQYVSLRRGATRTRLHVERHVWDPLGTRLVC